MSCSSSCSRPCPCQSRLSLERLNTIMRNPIQQTVCVPCCTPCPTSPPTWSNWPTKLLNVNVNVNVNKQEDLGGDAVASIHEAVNNALDGK